MIDSNSQFFAMLTAIGEAKQANADALGVPWKLTELGVGDANGTDPIPDRAQTKLINERRRRPLNKLSVDPANPNIIVAEQIIPADEGGWWIREIGLYDADGALVAVANCAPSYKPLMSQGSGRTQVVRMNFIVSSAANVVLKIDPAVVLATRQYVDDSVKNLAPIESPAFKKVPTAPTPPQFDSTTKLATTEYVQRALGSYSGQVNYAGDQVLTVDDVGRLVNFPQASIATLPLASTAVPGAVITIGSSLSGSVTVKPQGADTLTNLLTTPGPFIIPKGTLGVFRRLLGGSGWSFDSGDASLRFSPALSSWETKLPFTKDKSLATTEFVQKALGSFATARGVNASTVLTLDDVGASIGLGGLAAYTVTLPHVDDVPAGAAIGLHCRNGVGVTVASKTGSQISPQGAFLSQIIMAAGESALLVKEGSVWCVYGSAALKYSSQFAASLGTNGYQKLPSGDIEQWGLVVSVSAGSDTVITLPVALLEVPNNIQLTYANFTNGESVGSSPVLQARNSTKGSITVRNLLNGNASFFWRVRGKA